MSEHLIFKHITTCVHHRDLSFYVRSTATGYLFATMPFTVNSAAPGLMHVYILWLPGDRLVWFYIERLSMEI